MIFALLYPHTRLPLSLLIEGDAVRRLISGYREQLDESRHLHFHIIHGMIDAYLKTGHDVILDRMVFSAERLDVLCDIAKHNGADVCEIILWAGKEAVLKRISERGWNGEIPLTQEAGERFWNEIRLLKEKRPRAHVIDVETLSPDQIVEQIEKIIRE